MRPFFGVMPVLNNDKLLTFLRVDNEIIEKKNEGRSPEFVFSKISLSSRKNVSNLFIYIEEQLFFDQFSQGLYETA